MPSDTGKQSQSRSANGQRVRRVGFLALVATLLVVGVSARVAPMFNQDGRLLLQHPTEDGYLMLTIARNIAIGKGMTTADGTIPTNGTQPLCTLIWAIGYLLVGGDRILGVAIALVLSIFISLFAAWALYRMGRCVLAGHAHGEAVALLASALWFASPLCLPHTMNCLETGLFALTVILAVHAFVAGPQDPSERWSIGRCIGLGCLFGLAFWARNDACLLVMAACLTRLLGGVRLGRDVIARRAVETLVMGATALAIASPWLIYNRIWFGHFMPTSGVAFFLASLGSSLASVPVDLFAYLLALFPRIGGVVSESALIFGSTLCVVLVCAWLAIEVYPKAGPTIRTFLCVVGIYALALGTFYGVLFNAIHFMSRYLFPLAAFISLLWPQLAVHVWHRLRRSAGAPIATLAPLALLGLIVGLHVDAYRIGHQTRYFQFVQWVEANVSNETWVGAGQSSTLGYFHDRTVNLDGKVNPEALHARLHGGRPRYILDKNIRYVVDWDDVITQVAQSALIREHFVVEVLDPRYKLGVLRRITKMIPEAEPRTTTPQTAKPATTIP